MLQILVQDWDLSSHLLQGMCRAEKGQRGLRVQSRCQGMASHSWMWSGCGHCTGHVPPHLQTSSEHQGSGICLMLMHEFQPQMTFPVI